jgi:methylamine---glutamate N-methyltransferase subunit A
MCGIAGIFLKDHSLEPELGGFLAGMLVALGDRGPDSAGFAVYGDGSPEHVKLTLRAPDGYDFEQVLRKVGSAERAPEVHATHIVITVPVERQASVVAEIRKRPEIDIVSVGTRMGVFKEVGRPEEVATRFGLDKMPGTHAIGHTRMATESAITTNGAHPFTTGPDQCLVHNGSLSNHNAVRRELQREGLGFQTDNDSEVAAGFLTWKMSEGASLAQAMEASLATLDGFYTFVVGTVSGFGVLRDPIACKPAVMAETDRWVAFGTEYRALVDLPVVASARVWEPEPAKVYFGEQH